MLAAVILSISGSTISAPGGVVAPSGHPGAQRLVPRVAGAVHSGATDTQLPGRVTAAVAPEHLRATVSERGVLNGDDRSLSGSQGSGKPRSETCRSARRAVRWYRQRRADWLTLRGAASPTRGRSPRSCSDARYLSGVARSRSFAARRATERWQERLRWDVSLAINYVFGAYAGQAHRVVSCESGHSTTASNGQYRGLFQMGSSERATYGHGDSPLEQARAAHRYFVASGRDWSPWSCRP